MFVITLGFVPRLTNAQTPFVPYYGKNQIHYDTFDWHVYTTDRYAD